MSTREPTGTPGELRLIEHQLPRPAETPPTHAPTPGAALAGARPPAGPTLPDPADLGTMIARMANEMFTPAAPGVPTTSPVPAPPAVALSPTLGASTARVPDRAPPAPVMPPETAAPRAFEVSPFVAPLRLDALGDLGGIPIASPGLIDAPLPLDAPHRLDAPHADGAPAMPVDTSLPYWMTPSAKELARPEAPAISLDAFQLDALRPEAMPELGVRDTGGTAFDPHAIRREFPILEERVHGKRLVWLDNAATTQKPQAVIDRLSYYYEHENSNIHRAAHTLAARATDAYESARESVRRFIRAPSKNEIVFVRGATEGINLVAKSWGAANVREGDEVVITWLEHHANIVPWQQLCAEVGARLRVAPVDDRGQVILDEYERLLGPKTRIVALPQVSNALGTVTPAREMIEMAHRHGAKVLLDAAQSVSHMPVDVQALDCDFLVFSGHKIFAPTGIGVVYGKRELLEATPPWQGGGNMIQDVTFERTLYWGPPARFEAGTGNIADAIGLGTALDWLSRIGVENVGRYEHELLAYATAKLLAVPGLTIIGTAAEKAGVISFVLAGQKTEEVGGILDKEGIAVRSGHHCAQPILRRFGVEATVRASLAPYNTLEDIDALCAALIRLQTGR